MADEELRIAERKWLMSPTQENLDRLNFSRMRAGQPIIIEDVRAGVSQAGRNARAYLFNFVGTNLWYVHWSDDDGETSRTAVSDETTIRGAYTRIKEMLYLHCNHCNNTGTFYHEIEGRELPCSCTEILPG